MAENLGQTLVTGGTGFLGGRLIERLVEQGTPVRALVRRSLPRHLAALDVATHLGDLVGVRTLAGALDGVDTVFHCAGMVTDYGSMRSFMRVNGTGAANLVDVALAAGVRRFVHVSTTDVYGYQSTPQPESAAPHHSGPGYNASKIFAEHVVRRAGAMHGLPFTIVRPANIYGPRSDSFVVEIAELLRAGQMVLIGDGRQDAGLAYVDNVVDLMLAAATAECAVGEIYNACDCNGVTWREYCDALADLVGAEPCRLRVPYGVAYPLGALLEWGSQFIGRRERPLLTRTAVALLGIPGSHQNAKAREQLGWEPRVSFEEGMRRIKAWLPESVLAKR